MNIKAKLFVCGEERELIATSLNYIRLTDWNGKPTSALMGGAFTVTFKPEIYDDTFIEWIIADRKDNKKIRHPFNLYLLRDGKVVFYEDDFDGVELFQYNFQDGVLINYHEVFDNQKGMQVTLTISPAMQDYRFFNNSTDWRRKSRTRYIKPWQESFIPPIEDTPYKAQEDTTPRVIKVNWINKSNEVVNSSHYEENLGLEIDLNNPNGGKVKISIAKKDNTSFDNNTKEIVLEEYVTGNKVTITDFKVKKEWEGFKNVEIDELVATATYFSSTKESTSLEIIAPPKVIVDFRPSKNYSGEYGFDYIRHKKEKDDYITYEDIVGPNQYNDFKLKKRVKKFKKDPLKYKKLKDNEYKVLTFPWYKDSAGKEIEYIQSWLTLYPQQTVTLSLQLETINNPKKLDVCLEYDTELFKLSTDTIPGQSKKKKRLDDFLTVECLKEFSTDQTIKVMYGNQQLGQLNILANAKSKRKKLDVVFVEVTTRLKVNSKEKTGKSTGKKAYLEKYLKQSLINPNVTVELLDLKKDAHFNKQVDPNGQGYIENRRGLHDYLNGKMNTKYKNYLKVYFIGDQCPVLDKNGNKTNRRVNGQSKDFNSDAVVLFKGHNVATVAHEALHALGLYHTFSSKANYTYKKGETYNIMDYSHWGIYGNKKRILTWLWQWKKLWNNSLVKSE